MNQSALRETFAAAYAAGRLDPALSLLVETQAAVSDEAARLVGRAEAFTGALLEAEAPAALAPDALERAFAMIAAAPAQERAPLSVSADEDLPEPVRRLAARAHPDAAWKFAGFGIRSLRLAVEGDSIVELLRIAPNARAPRHTHNGAEYTLVLTGAFRDDRGLYRVGDIAVSGPGVAHRPVAEGEEVCFSLAVSEATPTLAGAFGVVQKLWRH